MSICDTPFPVSTTSDFFSCKYESRFTGSGIYHISKNIFQNEDFMEAWVAGRAAFPMEAAASSVTAHIRVFLLQTAD
jgi:hypothetical protein